MKNEPSLFFWIEMSLLMLLSAPLAKRPPISIIAIFIPLFISKDETISPFCSNISNITSAVISADTPPVFATAVKPLLLKACFTRFVIKFGFVLIIFWITLPNGPDTYAPNPPKIKPFFHFVSISSVFSSVNPLSLVRASIAVKPAGTDAIDTVMPAFTIWAVAC